MKRIIYVILLFVCFAFQYLEAKQITGIVESSSGEALIGVAIRHIDKQIGTITDHEGKFAINVADGDVLSFSYIGFFAYELKVDKNYFFASTYVAKSKWHPNLFNKDRYDFFNDTEGNFYVISKKAAYGDKPIEYNTNLTSLPLLLDGIYILEVDSDKARKISGKIMVK